MKAKPKFTPFILFMMFLPLHGMTQNLHNPIHELRLKIGLGYGQLKDKAVSRLIYEGLVVSLSIDYTHAWGANQLQIGLDGYFSQPKSKFEDGALWVNYGLYAGYNRLVHTSEGFQVRMGGKVPFSTTIDFFKDIRAEYFYWLSTTSFNPTIIIEKIGSPQNYFYAEMDIALFGIFSRPPLERFTNAEDNFGFILKETNTNYRSFFLPEHLALNFRSGIAYQLNHRIHQRLSYQLQYIKNPNPEPITWLIHELNLSTTFNRKDQ